MKMIVFGPTEIIFLSGLFLLSSGVTLLFGFAWGLIASGSILLATAFLNAAQREEKSEKGK